MFGDDLIQHLKIAVSAVVHEYWSCSGDGVLLRALLGGVPVHMRLAARCQDITPFSKSQMIDKVQCPIKKVSLYLGGEEALTDDSMASISGIRIAPIS
jgi:hypothetical protein